MKRENINTIIESTKNHLVEEYGEIKPEWELQLILLEDTLDMIVRMEESISETGLFIGGRKNPLITSLKDAQVLVLKLSQKLGCSPYDISKIKKLTEDDGTDDFIESLTAED